jgi:hypothetical protein
MNCSVLTEPAFEATAPTAADVASCVALTAPAAVSVAVEAASAVWSFCFWQAASERAATAAAQMAMERFMKHLSRVWWERNAGIVMTFQLGRRNHH